MTQQGTKRNIYIPVRHSDLPSLEKLPIEIVRGRGGKRWCFTFRRRRASRRSRFRGRKPGLDGGKRCLSGGRRTLQGVQQVEGNRTRKTLSDGLSLRIFFLDFLKELGVVQRNTFLMTLSSCIAEFSSSCTSRYVYFSSSSRFSLSS